MCMHGCPGGLRGSGGTRARPAVWADAARRRGSACARRVAAARGPSRWSRAAFHDRAVVLKTDVRFW